MLMQKLISITWLILIQVIMALQQVEDQGQIEIHV